MTMVGEKYLPSAPPAFTPSPRIWIGKLTLTDFRNYRAASITAPPGLVVLTGQNGAGKTNCLEAVSLLTAGRGLRSLPFPELARGGGSGGWAIAARISIADEELEIGTGVQPSADGSVSARAARVVKIDQALAKGSGALARIRMVWLTPAMDGLFTGPAGDRRRFLDRLALSLDPTYASAAAIFERAMRQRNKALEMGGPAALLDGIEAQMADAAVAIVEARVRAVENLASEIAQERERAVHSAFPWAALALQGHLEEQASRLDLSEISETYRRLLARTRDRDAAAGRTLIGPHRSDLEVTHGPKGILAKMCSTGEQKALLIGLVLAQARSIKKQSCGCAPLILLDEIAAHLDAERRAALFSSITNLHAQVWMTGTDPDIFSPLRDVTDTQFFHVANGSILPANDAESTPGH